MNSPSDLLARALPYHRAGDLDRAEPLYRQALECDPSNADAWHLLGELCTQARAGRISPHSTSATPWPCGPAKRDSSLTKGSRSRHWAVSPRPRPASAPRSTRSPSLRKRTTTWPTPCKPWVITRKRWPTGGRRWPCGPSTPTRGRTWPCLWSIMATRSKPPSKPARPSRLAPSQPTPHLALAGALTGLKQYQAAEAACQEALRWRPDLATAHRALRASCGCRVGLQEALDAARETLRLDPHDAYAHVEAGVVLGCLGNPGEAELRLRYAAWLRPDNAEARHNLAVLFVGQRRFAQAVDLFQQALRLRPGLSEAAWGWPAPGALGGTRCGGGCGTRGAGPPTERGSDLELPGRTAQPARARERGGGCLPRGAAAATRSCLRSQQLASQP